MTPDELSASRARQGRPVDAQTRQSVVDLHGEGWSRNDIARHLGIAGATVTRIAQEQEPPLQFDRSATALAVAARQMDLAAARADLSAMLLLRGREALEAMESPIEVYSFGGKDNVFASEVIDAPSPADQRNLMTIAAIAVQRHVELVRIDGDGAQVEVDSVLGSLASGFDVAAAALRASAGGPVEVVVGDESE